MKARIGIFSAVATLFALAFASQADAQHVTWNRNGAPAQTYITGGGWTLEQGGVHVGGAAVGLKSAGYCDANGNQIGNPETERMQPY